MIWLYWQIGHRLRQDVVGEGRAAYGEKVVAHVAAALSAEYGRGFSKRNLHHMLRFAEVFPDPEIVTALRSQLSWTHLREIIALDDPLQRRFYVELCRLEGWSTRALQAKIAGMLYERTAIAKRPAAVVEEALSALGEDGRMTPDLVFRDPYVLDFLGLPADHGEHDLEAAILRELESFLLEMGQGFCFIARQKRMSIGADDYYLDLLFFHRTLRALVAVELKLGRFDARDKGQMELYLRWLDKHERQPHESRAARADPLRRQERRADRAPPAHGGIDPRGELPDGAAPARAPRGEARRWPSPTRAGRSRPRRGPRSPRRSAR